MNPFSFGSDRGADRRARAVAIAAHGIAPGWYGKLPSLGDFATRRLLPQVSQAWDAWLAAGLTDWSAHDPGGWLRAYLAAPSWRFLLASGGRRSGDGDAFGAAPAWAGVLMPSVDRVGRYYPFTLLRPLARLPAGADEARELLGWLHRADDAAVDALHEGWTVERLEAALETLAASAPGWFSDARRPGVVMSAFASRSARPAADDADDTVILDDPDETLILDDAAPPPAPRASGNAAPRHGPDIAAVLGAIAPSSRGQARPAGDRVWWFCSDPVGALHLRATPGLPRGADFASLLGFVPPRVR